MSWNLPLHSSNFPPALQASLPAIVAVDESDLFWGAITVGRPNLQSVLLHGQYSIDEALFRWSVVRANLTVHLPISGLHNSSAFNALDPTEKAWINFALGMIITKICAQKHLGLPWLMHFKWFAASNPVQMATGGSTPDFIGLNASTGQYHVLEAKGRNAGFSNVILDQAKTQALQAISIAGQPCLLHIGAMLYRLHGQRLAFAWRDPEPDDRDAFKIEETQETWREYYRVVWGLSSLDEGRREQLAALTGWYVDIDPEVDQCVERLVSDVSEGWEEARDNLVGWAAEWRNRKTTTSMTSARSKTFPDGIRLRPAIPDRFGEAG